MRPTDIFQHIRARRSKIFYGWYIVAACSAMTVLLSTTVFSYGLYFTEIRSTFGWSSAATSAAFSFQRLQGGFAQPLAGFLVDRLGSRKMVLAGILLIGSGWILLSRVQELWQFYASLLTIAFGMSIGFGMAFNTSLINWFRRNRSRALGLVWSGTPLSGPLVGVVALLIIHLGWRDSAVVVGITIWAIGFPLALVIRHRPEPYGYLPDGDAPGEDAQTGQPLAAAEPSGLTLREALRSRSFYILSIGIGIEAMVVSSLIVHQVAHLKNEGLSTGAAALVVSAAASAFLIGRLPFALLGDKVDKGRLLTIIYLLSAIAVVAFAYADAIWPIAIFVLLLGISHGIITPLRPSAIADYLGTRSFGSIAGVFELPSIIGGVMGPLIMGWVFDWRDDYRLALFAFSAALALTSPFFLLLRRPQFTGSR